MDTSPTEQIPTLGAEQGFDIPEPDEGPAVVGSRLHEDRDRLATMLAVGLIVLGFLFMGGAWYGASGRNFIQQQFPYLLSGTIPGLALALIGGGIVVVRDIRRERQAMESRVARLEELIEASLRGGARASASAGRTNPADTGIAATNNLVVRGRTTFHLPTCRLALTKQGLESSSREEAVAAGLNPCRICAP